MLLSFNWLREFVPFEGTVQELGDRLTMLGLELEEIIRPFAHMDKVVVGHVVECERHPEAEKLSITKVDVGQGELLPIVCGAPNVAKGQKVPVALIGATLPSGLTIKKAKLRGQESRGMICAEDEIGLGEGQAGILVLDEILKVGTPLVEALNLDDVVLDIGITPNRADCLSVLGLARETAMAFNLPLTMPAVGLKEEAESAAEHVKIVIDDPELCPLYQARVLREVQVAPAPAWMRYRLMAIGQRPINNIVDVTNYILFELGHPLHAFDQDLLEGKTIRVGTASDGMKFTTLDEKERELTSADLLIWDEKKPIGLAGVMGGANSEVHDGSKNVLLECAVFRPGTIRKTARKLAIPSEASYRFERGVDQTGAQYAVDRAAALMAECADAKVLSGIVAEEPKPWIKRSMTFRKDRAESLLGIELDTEFCKTTLTGLGCEIDDADPAAWKIVAPGNRLDFEREADLIEEVGRVYGMDRIPVRLPKVAKSIDDIGSEDSYFSFTMLLKEWAYGLGLNEAVNYSFVGQSDLDHLGLPTDERIPVANPLSEDQNVLRTRLAPGLFNTLKHNLAHGATRLTIFEVAKTFRADAASETTAIEPSRMGLMFYGSRRPDLWPYKGRELDFSDVRGHIDALLDRLLLPKASYNVVKEHPYLNPCVQVTLGDEVLGEAGRVDPDKADFYYARKPVWYAELDVDLLKRLHEAQHIGFQPLPVFPPIRRDTTFIAPKALQVAELDNAAAACKEDLLESMVLVDVFEPEGGEERNLTYRFTYRHPDKTLKDKDVDKRHAKVLEALLKDLPLRV